MTTYFVRGGTGGTDAGTSWANAAESIPGLMTAQAIAGGDIICVHPTHSYAPAAGITWTLPESGTGTVVVQCVDGGDAAWSNPGAMGTTVGSLTTGALENTNANASFNIDTVSSVAAGLYVHGISFKAGAGGLDATGDINVKSSGNNGRIVFNACSFWTNSTSTSALMTLGGNVNQIIEFYDSSFRFGSTSGAFYLASAQFEFHNCSINASGSSPTSLFTFNSNRDFRLLCSSCDWSLATNVVSVSGATNCGQMLFNNCTIATPVTGTHPGMAGLEVEFHACAAVDGTNGANTLAYYKDNAFGVVQDDQTVYVTTGPAQGTQDDGTATSYSLKMTPSALALVYQPLYTPWIYTKVASTGSKTISMKVADTEGALLKNSELWLEVEYMGGAAPANSPQTALEGTYPLVGTYHDVTAAGSNLTDTGEAWTGIAETGTYTLSKTVTLDEQGYIRCRVGLGKDTTNPVYVDPKITVA